jgi:hypothetical protein
LPAEDLDWIGFQPRHLVGPLLEMLVHAVQPERQPAAARFEERDLQARKPLGDAAGDHRQRGEHLLKRVRDHVRHEEIIIAVEAGGRDLPVGALVEHDRHAQPLRLGP